MNAKSENSLVSLNLGIKQVATVFFKFNAGCFIYVSWGLILKKSTFFPQGEIL
jgi:hypothetical protein